MTESHIHFFLLGMPAETGVVLLETSIFRVIDSCVSGLILPAKKMQKKPSRGLQPLCVVVSLYRER
jgi:hypothetical protein